MLHPKILEIAMKTSTSAAARAARATIAALGAVIIGLGLTETMAQSPHFNTDISIAELMEALVMPEADVIWGAIQYTSSEDGSGMIGPETDEEWLAVRHSALALAEVANNLMIPGRPANKPGTAAQQGELAPAAVEALINQNRDAWNAYAATLHAVAMQAIEAIDARDADKIFLDSGGDLDAACEACHLTFWYPDQ
jgi:cytochrome c556